MRRLLLLTVLVLTVPALPAHAGGGCHSPAVSDEAKTEVLLAGNCFSPTITRVDAGDVVTFVNLDEMPHRLDAPGMWGLDDDFDPGAEASFRFSNPGVFPYACFIHLGMTGAIVVGDGVLSDTEQLGITKVSTKGNAKAVDGVDASMTALTKGGGSGGDGDTGGTGVESSISASASVEETPTSGVLSAVGVVLAGTAALALAWTAMALRRRRAIVQP